MFNFMPRTHYAKTKHDIYIPLKLNLVTVLPAKIAPSLRICSQLVIIAALFFVTYLALKT